MGFFSKVWKGYTGLLKGAAKSVGSALGLSTHNSEKLIKKQEESQENLNASNAQRNYEYGEMAADAAYQRQLGLNESQNYQNTVQDVKDAGLSVGLLYGGGGAGGSGGGRASQGDGAGGQNGMAPDYLAVEQIKNQKFQNSIEAARAATESRLTNAEVDRTKAETERIKEETASSVERSPIENELLSQQAISAYIDNIRKEFENTGEEVGYHGKYADVFISNKGNFSKQQAAEIAKAVSEADKNNAAAALDTEKKQGYWQELLNATRREDTEAAKAAAVKLAAEWSTGEYTNWKTWSELATQGVGAIKDIIGIVK